MRELKQSPTGLLSMTSAFAAIVFFLFAVARSFQMSGNANVYVGSFGLVALVLALGAWIMGIQCMREQNVRPIPPRMGMILGAILTLVLGGMYVYGWV